MFCTGLPLKPKKPGGVSCWDPGRWQSVMIRGAWTPGTNATTEDNYTLSFLRGYFPTSLHINSSFNICVFMCMMCFCVFSLHLMFGKHVHPRVFSLYWSLFLFSFYIKLGLFSCNLINPTSSAVSPITQRRRRLPSNPWLLQSSHWQSELLTRLHIIPIRLHFIYCTSRLPTIIPTRLHISFTSTLHLIPNQATSHPPTRLHLIPNQAKSHPKLGYTSHPQPGYISSPTRLHLIHIQATSQPGYTHPHLAYISSTLSYVSSASRLHLSRIQATLIQI